MFQISGGREANPRNVTGFFVASGLSAVLWIVVLTVVTKMFI